MRLNMFCLISDSVLMILERNWFLSDVETISLALEEEPQSLGHLVGGFFQNHSRLLSFDKVLVIGLCKK